MTRRAVRLHPFQPDCWSAGRTRDRLRVKATVGWLYIFAVTVGAHGEVRHCRIDTVVGNFLHDGEAWSAVRAVREWITVSPLVRIEYFRTTRGADGGIGSDACAVFTTDAFGNAEVFKVEQVQDLCFDIFDLRQRRRFGVQAGKKLRDGAGISGSAD